MFRRSRFSTWGPGIFVCVAVAVALRAAEVKQELPRELRPAEPSVPALTSGGDLPTFKIAPGTPVNRVVAGNADPSSVAGASDKLVYDNPLGSLAVAIPNGAFVSDDLTLNMKSGCALTKYTFAVIGKADLLNFQGGNYKIDYQLYSQCPGAGGKVIAGTEGSITFTAASTGDPDFDKKIQEVVVMPPPGTVALPPVVWLGLKANRNNVGVLIGAPALTGFSSDRLDFPGFACNADAGGFPQHPYAAFRSSVSVDSACTDAYPGYHNTQPGRGGFTEGANKCMADDIQLQQDQCNMVALEVNVRGTGFYRFDVRSNVGGLPGSVIPGTARTRSVPSTATGAQLVRFNYDPPISLGSVQSGGQRVWVTFEGNNTGAGWVLTRKDADIGSTAQTYARSMSGAPCSSVNDWETLNPADPTAHGGFDVTIYCENLPPKGQCCDMYLTDDGACELAETHACLGGPNPGAPCTSTADCGFGICATSKCTGGQFDGEPCVAEIDCKGDPQCRFVPEMNCSFPPRGTQFQPRWNEGAPCRRCVGGANDGDACEVAGDCPDGSCDPNTLPGQKPCGVAACCTPDESGCAFLTEKECERLSPPYEPNTRSWSLGRYCSVQGFTCPRTACLGKPGSCTVERPRICEGGTRNGLSCTGDSACRVTCSGRRCFGGPHAGQTCVSNANCAGPPNGTCLFVCNGGPHDLEQCLNDAICNNDGVCQTFDAGGNSYCVGGQDAGSECRTSLQCRGGTCSTKHCVGGDHAGDACEGDRDCRGAICSLEPGCSNPFCCTEVCDWEFRNLGTTFCCDFHWDRECARIANQENLPHCNIAPDHDSCAAREEGVGGARPLPFPGTEDVALDNATFDATEPGFCCHNGFAPHCEGGDFEGLPCDEQSDCTPGTCVPKTPSPGQRGAASVWYRFTPPGTGTLNVQVTTCSSTGLGATDSLLQVYATTDPDGGLCQGLGRCSDNGDPCLLTDENPCNALAVCEPVSQACSLSEQDCPLEGSDCVFDVTTSCGKLVVLGCNDDAADGCNNVDRAGNSKLCLPGLQAGQTYFVQLASKTEATSRSYKLQVSSVGSCPSTTAANDACARATPIGDGVFPFNLANATFDCPAPDCLPGSQNDLWWKFTPTISGKATVQTCGGSPQTTPDTEMAIYDGCDCPSSITPPTPLCCSTFAGGQCQDGSLCSIDVTAGHCYLVRVGDRQGLRGQGNLTITTMAADCNNNGQADTCDLSCAAPGCAGVPGCGTHSDCNTNGIPDECEPDPGCCPNGPVTFIEPLDGTVDARSPIDPFSGGPAGVSQVQVTGPAGAGPQCWSLCETASNGAPNGIAAVLGAGGNYTLILNRPITPNACTTITYLAGNGARPQGRFVSHPGNVNGDGTAETDDVQRLIDTLNAGGVSPANAPWGPLSSDIDHSGLTAAPDIIELINDLIGAGALDPTNNTAKPACTACPPPP